VKEAFFIISSSDYLLNYEQFVKTLRALGTVISTKAAYEAFLSTREKELSW
jgi:hypothetical protein